MPNNHALISDTHTLVLIILIPNSQCVGVANVNQMSWKIVSVICAEIEKFSRISEKNFQKFKKTAV